MLKKIEDGWHYKGLEHISDDHKQALKDGYENWLKNGDRDDIGKRIINGWGQKRDAFLEYMHSEESHKKRKITGINTMKTTTLGIKEELMFIRKSSLKELVTALRMAIKIKCGQFKILRKSLNLVEEELLQKKQKKN